MTFAVIYNYRCIIVVFQTYSKGFLIRLKKESKEEIKN